MRGLRLDAARTAADAALEHATRAGASVAVVVLDAAGEPRTASVQDGALLTAPLFARKKAFTALAFRSAPEELELANDPLNVVRVMTADDRLLFVGGALPIRSDGEVVGAIGVAGGSPADDRACCEAALAALDG